jgi:hypothetical protein
MPKKKSKNYEFVDALLDKAGRESIEALPCEIFEADGAHGFRFAYVDKPGVIALEFYSHGLAEWGFQQAKAIMREMATAMADRIAQPDREKLLTYVPTDEETTVVAQTIARVFINGMSGKMRSLLGELEQETLCYVYEVVRKTLPEDIKPQFNSVEQLANEMAIERKRFLKGSIAYFGEPRWGKMKGYYDSLLLIAQKAKGIHENYKEDNWRGMIKAACPELDEDLVTLLSNDTNDLACLPESVSKATENSEDYSKPSNLALEQAARKCGMKPFNLSPRTLRDRMDNQRSAETATRKSVTKKTNHGESGKPKARTRKAHSGAKMESDRVH